MEGVLLADLDGVLGDDMGLDVLALRSRVRSRARRASENKK